MPTIDAVAENAAPDLPILITTAAFGPGTYTFSDNITKNRHGIVIACDDVIVDLNDKTLIFDNDAAITDITNGDFETDALESVTVTGWDVTGVTNPIIKANDTQSMLFNAGVFSGTAGKVLRLNGFTSAAAQVIKSSNVAITDIDMQHGFHISCACRSANADDYLLTIKFDVHNAVGDALIATKTISSYVDRGQLSPLYFVPNAASIYFKVTITAPSANSVILDLDFATCRRAQLCGVICSRLAHADASFPNAPAMGAAAQAAYTTATTSANRRVTVKNGTISQGANNGMGNYSIYDNSGNGLTTGGSAGNALILNVDGIDPRGIYMENFGNYSAKGDGSDSGSQPVSITYTTIDMTGAENISNRTVLFAAIMLEREVGTALISNNTLDDIPQVGILITDLNVGTSVTVNDNAIDQLKIATNGYAILVNGSNDVTVDGNTITGVGRGISIDAYSSRATSDVNATDNTITLTDTFDRENTGPTGSPCRGMRIRNNAGSGLGAEIMTNLTVSGNTITVSTGNGATNVPEADALRVSFKNYSMDDAGIVISNNTLKATADTVNDTAVAFNITGCEADINLSGSGNSCESNYRCVQILSSDGPQTADDITFTSTTFIDSATGYDFGGAKGLSVGLSTYPYSNIRFTKNVFTGIATADEIYFPGTGTGTVYVGKSQTVTVKDGAGAALAAALVTVEAGTWTTLNSVETNGSGLAIPDTVDSLYTNETPAAEAALYVKVVKGGYVQIRSQLDRSVTATPTIACPAVN